MPAIVVLGKKEFVLGFELAGIKDTITATEEDLKQKAEQALGDKTTGILVMHKNDVSSLPLRIQEKFDNSVTPVTVSVTEDKMPDEGLRKQIQKAIGVDVWNK